MQTRSEFFKEIMLFDFLWVSFVNYNRISVATVHKGKYLKLNLNLLFLALLFALSAFALCLLYIRSQFSHSGFFSRDRKARINSLRAAHYGETKHLQLLLYSFIFGFKPLIFFSCSGSVFMKLLSFKQDFLLFSLLFLLQI